MPGEEDKSRELIELIGTGVAGAGLAALFQALRAMRKHGGDDFSPRRMCVGLASAAAIGAIVAWALDAVNVPRQLSAVIISMCGYTGGRLLDIIESEVPETLQAAFDALQKRIKHKKWGAENSGAGDDGDDIGE